MDCYKDGEQLCNDPLVMAWNERNRVRLSSRVPDLSAAEIIRELRRLRYDPANGRGRGRKVPINYVAELAGLHRMTLYRAILRGQVSDKSRAALSRALYCVTIDDVPPTAFTARHSPSDRRLVLHSVRDALRFLATPTRSCKSRSPSPLRFISAAK